MTKDVLISLRGLQFDQSDSDVEKIETIMPGSYYEKNGSHYVLYDEIMEGFSEPVKNRIKFGEHALELTRSGAVNVHMIFEENRKNMTSYNTPYGNILIGIDTRKIHITQESDRIVVDVDYALDVNYEYLADCQIVLDIRSKGSIEKII
ncbi:MAG: DUF1934 domain-containing protein [Lachnospiraceae bacterium]|jgi:uncharacterized beta-barrel protein YwiB (DUF1934 family)|nr:DUF1934 domain-containing protein [Lachnospiraceae bacterium]